MIEITGADLIRWGFKPGKAYKAMLQLANEMRSKGSSDNEICAAIGHLVPIEIGLRTNSKPFAQFIDKPDVAIIETMDALMRTPTLEQGAVMPDACMAGTIPVGGVVAANNAIHPGFHSADICCSMSYSAFKRNDPKQMLDAVQAVTHFGYGGRDKPIEPPKALMEAMSQNPFLNGLENYARYHFGTQGDGNHFAFVGRSKVFGGLCLVTHHGSRGLGAQLYKRGMRVAQKHTAILAPRVPSQNAWLDASSFDGQAYWDALQLVRQWTKLSHEAIHQLAAREAGNAIVERFWNEHNFVFRRGNTYFHAKGATPMWDAHPKMIPLNMAEPILVVAPHSEAPKDALGFAPHGAGRDMSRTRFLRENTNLEPPAGIDVRSFSGTLDKSELPQAYKPAAEVREQIERFKLATIIDEIHPYGSIMAGELPQPWRK